MTRKKYLLYTILSIILLAVVVAKLIDGSSITPEYTREFTVSQFLIFGLVNMTLGLLIE